MFGSFCLVNSELVSCDTGYNCGLYGYVNSRGFTPGMKLHCDKGGRVRNDGGSMHACVEYVSAPIIVSYPVNLKSASWARPGVGLLRG